MGRAQKQRRFAKGAGKSVEVKPSAVTNPGPTRKTGLERPDPFRLYPTDLADPVARVIRTRK